MAGSGIFPHTKASRGLSGLRRAGEAAEKQRGGKREEAKGRESVGSCEPVPAGIDVSEIKIERKRTYGSEKEDQGIFHPDP